MLIRRRRTIAHELIAADAGGSFTCRRFRTTHWPLNWHSHPELELTLIIRGEGLRYVGDSVAQFSTGDLVLLGPGVPHSWSSKPQPRLTCESLVAQFPEDVLGAGWASSAESRPLASVIERAAQGLVITGSTAVAVRADLLALGASTPGLLRLGLLLTILGRISSAPAAEVASIARLPAARLHAARGPLRMASRADPWAALIQHLDAHADGPLSTTGLAARIGLSPTSFARAFRRRFRCTCTDYLGRIRLARVCRALVETDQTIASIAFSAGFSNLANFNRRFRAAYALTPRAYRQQQRTGL